MLPVVTPSSVGAGAWLAAVCCAAAACRLATICSDTVSGRGITPAPDDAHDPLRAIRGHELVLLALGARDRPVAHDGPRSDAGRFAAGGRGRGTGGRRGLRLGIVVDLGLHGLAVAQLELRRGDLGPRQLLGLLGRHDDVAPAPVEHLLGLAQGRGPALPGLLAGAGRVEGLAELEGVGELRVGLALERHRIVEAIVPARHGVGGCLGARAQGPAHGILGFPAARRVAQGEIIAVAGAHAHRAPPAGRLVAVVGIRLRLLRRGVLGASALRARSGAALQAWSMAEWSQRRRPSIWTLSAWSATWPALASIWRMRCAMDPHSAGGLAKNPN
jgi:hypothetical protein